MNQSLLLAAAVGICGAACLVTAQTPDASAARVAGMPLIIAHRGVPSEVPENTVISFRRGWEQGADAVESDFHLTSDGKIICIHDKDTKRVTGVDLTVADATFDQLRALDAGKWKGDAYQGAKLPTLVELLETVPAGKQVFLEIKSGPEIVPEFVRQLRASSLKPEQIVVISFNDPVIPAIKAAMPEVKAFLLYEFKKDKQGRWTETADDLVARAKTLGADGLDLSMKPKAIEAITPDLVAKAKAAGMSFHVWTIDDVAVARQAIELGAASITTNRAGALRAELQAMATTRPFHVAGEAAR